MEYENTVKVKDFSVMSIEEKETYAERWRYFQIEVMRGFAAALELYYGKEVSEVEFDEDIKVITNNNPIEAGHLILDIHELFELEVLYPITEVYDIFDTLFDIVLMLSSELTDRELGYTIALKEVEMR